MSEVEKLTTSPTSPVSTTGGGDVPSGVENSDGDLGTSPPTQERSSNSHQHDSEYDTASDLYYDEDGESASDEDLSEEMSEEDDSLSDEEGSEDENAGGAGQQEKSDVEAPQKKVDEDRSNPQYIPKRGTFYEHDDRMADTDNVLAIGDSDDIKDAAGSSASAGGKPTQSSSISQASKTMKKWQPASAVERWSHDRYDEGEQAPKSRTELVSAYGYDIRTEDAPPKARRRRRYAKGPSKYLRNWEDESAYVKAPNKERKPPRASDFPALNERRTKNPIRSENSREDKENRIRKQGPMPGSRNVGERNAGGASGSGIQRRTNYRDDNRDRDGENRSSGGSNQRNRNERRQNAVAGRQAPMEFKQKNRNANSQNHQQQMSNSQASSLSSQSNSYYQNTRSDDRNQEKYHNPQQRLTHNMQNNVSQDQQKPLHHQQQHQQNIMKNNMPIQSMNQYPGQQQQQQLHNSHKQMHMHQQNDIYSNSNNSNSNAGSYANTVPIVSNNHHQAHTMHQQPLGGAPRQPVANSKLSNIQQRLQQAQHRNEPSHVGSIPMHSLANQGKQQSQPNQHVMVNQQSQQQNPNNLMMGAGQPVPIPQEQRSGPPKRYSSIRRSQHEVQHMGDHHQPPMQQMHPIPHTQSQPGQPAPLILQDQHMMPSNLMQMYHQDNLQAQMQALQINQGTAPQNKQPNFPAVPAGPTAGQAPPPQAQNYYVPGPTPDVSAASFAPPPSNYLPPAQAAPPLNYTGPPPPAPVTTPIQTPATNPPYVQGVPTPGGPGYQNYNTVGGTTYFVPPAQATTRPVSLPQRRPTNAIPILPPSEKNKQRGDENSKTGPGNANNPNAAAGSAENIDHILDNMFTQRQPYQPPPQTPQSGSAPQQPPPPQQQQQQQQPLVRNSSTENATNQNSNVEPNVTPQNDDNVVTNTPTSELQSSTITKSNSNNNIGNLEENPNNSTATDITTTTTNQDENNSKPASPPVTSTVGATSATATTATSEVASDGKE